MDLWTLFLLVSSGVYGPSVHFFKVWKHHRTWKMDGFQFQGICFSEKKGQFSGEQNTAAVKNFLMFRSAGLGSILGFSFNAQHQYCRSYMASWWGLEGILGVLGGLMTRWWFQIFFIFTPKFGKGWTHFDLYFSKGLTPPTRWVKGVFHVHCTHTRKSLTAGTKWRFGKWCFAFQSHDVQIQITKTTHGTLKQSKKWVVWR